MTRVKLSESHAEVQLRVSTARSSVLPYLGKDVSTLVSQYMEVFEGRLVREMPLSLPPGSVISRVVTWRSFMLVQYSFTSEMSLFFKPTHILLIDERGEVVQALEPNCPCELLVHEHIWLHGRDGRDLRLWQLDPHSLQLRLVHNRVVQLCRVDECVVAVVTRDGELFLFPDGELLHTGLHLMWVDDVKSAVRPSVVLLLEHLVFVVSGTLLGLHLHSRRCVVLAENVEDICAFANLIYLRHYRDGQLQDSCFREQTLVDLMSVGHVQHRQQKCTPPQWQLRLALSWDPDWDGEALKDEQLLALPEHRGFPLCLHWSVADKHWDWEHVVRCREPPGGVRWCELNTGELVMCLYSYSVLCFDPSEGTLRQLVPIRNDAHVIPATRGLWVVQNDCCRLFLWKKKPWCKRKQKNSQHQVTKQQSRFSKTMWPVVVPSLTSCLPCALRELKVFDRPIIMIEPRYPPEWSENSKKHGAKYRW